MNAFLWTVAVLLAFECAANLLMLSLQITPHYTLGRAAFNVAANGVLLCWAVVLLCA